LTCNAVIYHFRDICFFGWPTFWILGIPWSYRPKRVEAISGTIRYHHAKFHADR